MGPRLGIIYTHGSFPNSPKKTYTDPTWVFRKNIYKNMNKRALLITFLLVIIFVLLVKYCLEALLIGVVLVMVWAVLAAIYYIIDDLMS